MVVLSTACAAACAQEAYRGTPMQATAQDGYAAARSLELYREGNARMLMNDYGQLARYHDDDVKLGTAGAG